MLVLGESGRYEFKREVEVVSAGLLAALANWVAVDPTREIAAYWSSSGSPPDSGGPWLAESG